MTLPTHLWTARDRFMRQLPQRLWYVILCLALWWVPVFSTAGSVRAEVVYLSPTAGRLGEGKEGQEARDAVHNIRQAIAFLRQWGWTAFADNIESWLKQGKIAWDKDAADTETK